MANTQQHGPIGRPPSAARYWMSKDKHGNIVQGKERGKYTAVWVSTAAHGDTIFWKHDDDYLTAEGAKAYR